MPGQHLWVSGPACPRRGRGERGRGGGRGERGEGEGRGERRDTIFVLLVFSCFIKELFCLNHFLADFIPLKKERQLNIFKNQNQNILNKTIFTFYT